MLDVIPDDLAREKQRELAVHLADAQLERAKLVVDDESRSRAINVATRLLSLCGEAYARGDDKMRREWNQTWFEAIYITEDEHGEPTVESVRRTPFFEAVQTAEVLPARNAPAQPTDAAQNVKEPDGLGHRVLSRVGGSNLPLLVELRGLEPLTLCMPCRCATSCATAPNLLLPLWGDNSRNTSQRPDAMRNRGSDQSGATRL